MARKKQIHGKSRPHFAKNEVSLSQEDEAQIQQQLENYQDIVKALRSASTPETATSALEPLNGLSEQAQISFAKALIKEASLDAADLLQGMYDFSSSKEVSKEARRSLLRLESSQIYPQWTAPQSNLFPHRLQSSLSSSPEASSPWEDDYFGDDSSGGDSSGGNSIFKSLLNKRERGADTSPLEEFDFSDLIADEVVEDFLAYWTNGAFDKAYTMLAANSPLRENLPLERWVKRRRAWTEQFHPRDLELSEYSELETAVHKLASLPGMEGIFKGKMPDSEEGADSEQEEQSNEPENIRVFWSLVLDGRPESKALPEFPVATLVNPESGRHWFWTTFVCREEGDSWHVFDMIDEGAKLHQTPTKVLQQARATLITNAITKVTPLSGALAEEDDDVAEQEEDSLDVQGLSRARSEVLSYDDLLSTVGKADFTAFLELYRDAIGFGEFERSDVYGARMLAQFPRQRLAALREQASLLVTLLDPDTIEGEQERALPIAVRAENKLREAIALEPGVARDYIQLGQAHFYAESPNAPEETRQILEKAAALAQTPTDKLDAQLRLAELANFQKDVPQAITHYRRAVELDPTNVDAWHSLAHLQQDAGHIAEAEHCFLRYLELQPGEVNPYADLITFYRKRGEYAKSHEILDKGLALFDTPVALASNRATINAEGVLLAVEEGNLEIAERLLQTAEENGNGMHIVSVAAEALREIQRKQRKAERASSLQSKKHKKKH